jgi:hypothetical protein
MSLTIVTAAIITFRISSHSQQCARQLRHCGPEVGFGHPMTGLLNQGIGK